MSQKFLGRLEGDDRVIAPDGRYVRPHYGEKALFMIGGSVIEGIWMKSATGQWVIQLPGDAASQVQLDVTDGRITQGEEAELFPGQKRIKAGEKPVEKTGAKLF
jgi:hypothetical protein